MSWDVTWDDVFSARDWGRYPPEELIRFVARAYGRAPDRKAVRFLELGCGPGANIWYLAREGFTAYGIDGSKVAIEHASRRLALEGLEAKLIVGDFTELRRHYAPSSFDVVIDVAGLQHNRIAAVDQALEEVSAVLEPEGRVFSMLLAAGSWGEGIGVEVEPGTVTEVSAGPAAGAGVSHFFTLDEVERLFARFVDVNVEYVERSLDGRAHVYRHWIVTAMRST